jgi:hypothetical protein
MLVAQGDHQWGYLMEDFKLGLDILVKSER